MCAQTRSVRIVSFHTNFVITTITISSPKSDNPSRFVKTPPDTCSIIFVSSLPRCDLDPRGMRLVARTLLVTPALLSRDAAASVLEPNADPRD